MRDHDARRAVPTVHGPPHRGRSNTIYFRRNDQQVVWRSSNVTNEYSLGYRRTRSFKESTGTHRYAGPEVYRPRLQHAEISSGRTRPEAQSMAHTYD